MVLEKKSTTNCFPKKTTDFSEIVALCTLHPTETLVLQREMQQNSMEESTSKSTFKKYFTKMEEVLAKCSVAFVTLNASV